MGHNACPVKIDFPTISPMTLHKSGDFHRFGISHYFRGFVVPVPEIKRLAQLNGRFK